MLSDNEIKHLPSSVNAIFYITQWFIDKKFTKNI